MLNKTQLDEKLSELATLNEPLIPAIKTLIREVVAEIIPPGIPSDYADGQELQDGWESALDAIEAKAKELLG